MTLLAVSGYLLQRLGEGRSRVEEHPLPLHGGWSGPAGRYPAIHLPLLVKTHHGGDRRSQRANVGGLVV